MNKSGTKQDDFGKAGGHLEIQLLNGKLNPDAEIVDKMSPYVTFDFKEQTYKSKIHQDGGKTPNFGDKFIFDISSLNEEIIMKVWDKDNVVG